MLKFKVNMGLSMGTKAKPLPPQEILLEFLQYDEDTGFLRLKERSRENFLSDKQWRNWNNKNAGRRTFTATSNVGYKVGNFKGCYYLAHRIIWKMVYGVDPIFIDHLDHNRSNNKIINLRNVTFRTNGKNRPKPKNNTSGYTGVYKDKRNGKWLAHIRVNDKKRHLGSFIKLEDALFARKQAENKFGFHKNHGV